MCISPSSPLFEAAMVDLIDCGQAVADGSTDPAVFLRYADALWTVRDNYAAMAALDRAIAGEPPLAAEQLSKAYALRAICELQSGSLDKAITDISTSIDLFPRAHPFALRGMAHLFLGETAQAVVDVRESVRMDPGDWEARAWQAMILLEAGMLDEAIDDFTRAIDSGGCEKYNSELYLGRARARLALGQAEAAEDDCNAGIDLDYHEQAHWPFIVPSRARQAYSVYLVRAEARLALGKLTLSLGDCFFACGLGPGERAVYELRARVYHTLGNLPEAIRDTARVAYLESLPCPTDGAPRPATAELLASGV
jgi:tetratricopeptide (TPR) repeat protein